MDERRQDYYESEKKLKRLLRRSVQYVVLVSLFALFVWYSSGFSILPQSLNAYFSTFLFFNLTRTLQRKYMFLLCNVILAFLASNSLYDAPLVKGECYYEQVSSSELLLANQDYEPLLAETEEGKEHEEEGGGGKGINSEEVVEVELEDARKEEELANADELNRKFEEFIRKMKEEIRIEAQTPPIAV
ncbi:hypothetical protein HN51_002868 [Arachis hypogaea]|uniref:DUF4408 domain-containing protein n=2 Tax=Arachis TaxID=3817 RepID=A0A445EL86_ARAHY|nr:uncharacterized protein LOC107467093 [Arachis duranensis]XP_025666752.1 uncharacterized protein LOC112765070 [Arachis hypogaea]RYR76093.1 hypothetical protein Ahy_A01g000689 [Arachis hypogaea]